MADHPYKNITFRVLPPKEGLYEISANRLNETDGEDELIRLIVRGVTSDKEFIKMEVTHLDAFDLFDIATKEGLFIRNPKGKE